MRKCYGCGKELTAEEAVAGQIAFDEASVQSDGQLEGFVHCQGPPEVFAQEGDEELKKLWPGFVPGAAHICIVCASKMI